MRCMKENILLRSKAKTLEPVLRIGKSGLNEGTIKQLELLLQKKELIKIKFLKTSLGKSEKNSLINEILEKTGSDLLILWETCLYFIKDAKTRQSFSDTP